MILNIFCTDQRSEVCAAKSADVLNLYVLTAKIYTLVGIIYNIQLIVVLPLLRNANNSSIIALAATNTTSNL